MRKNFQKSFVHGNFSVLILAYRKIFYFLVTYIK